MILTRSSYWLYSPYGPGQISHYLWQPIVSFFTLTPWDPLTDRCKSRKATVKLKMCISSNTHTSLPLAAGFNLKLRMEVCCALRLDGCQAKKSHTLPVGGEVCVREWGPSPGLRMASWMQEESPKHWGREKDPQRKTKSGSHGSGNVWAWRTVVMMETRLCRAA